MKTEKNIFAYLREYEGKKMLVFCSFAEGEMTFRAPTDFKLGEAELVLSNYDVNPVIHNGFMSRPYETRVYLTK